MIAHTKPLYVCTFILCQLTTEIFILDQQLNQIKKKLLKSNWINFATLEPFCNNINTSLRPGGTEYQRDHDQDLW